MELVCDAETIKLSDISLSGMIKSPQLFRIRWSERKGGAELCPLQMSILMNTLSPSFSKLLSYSFRENANDKICGIQDSTKTLS